MKFVQLFCFIFNLFYKVETIIYEQIVDQLWTIKCHINFVKIRIAKCQLHRPTILFFLSYLQ